MTPILLSSARAVLAAYGIPESRWHGILARISRLPDGRVTLEALEAAIEASKS